MDNGNWLQLLGQETQMVAIQKTNQYTKKFGLTLTQEDTQLLLAERKSSLKEQARVEFGEGILPKLIFAFCDSTFINQENYVETIARLQEIFYLYKNESLDELSDEELIAYMKEKFDGVCQGSTDYLEDTCLENFARKIRKMTQGFIGNYEEEQEDEEEDEE